MILQALKAYYDRKAADSASDIAPFGWERKEIPYLIVLDRDGNLVNVEDTQERIGKKLCARSFVVPQSVKRTVGVEPYFLWDNVEYVTGINCKAGDQSKVEERHTAFMARLEPFRDIPAIRAVYGFLSSAERMAQLGRFEAWKEARESCAFVAFRFVDGSATIFDDETVRSVVNRLSGGGGGDVGIDLIGGEQGPVAMLHPAIKGISGANTTGANIVSFNFPAATSFGKKQGGNAPVGVRSAFEYTTALNTLLAKNSRQKMMVGDATVVFWAERVNPFEMELVNFFAEPSKDNPDRLSDSVKELFRSPKTGAFAPDHGGTRFYVLGLSPNAARIAVRFWHVGTVSEMAGRFREYFDDLMIVHGAKDREHLSMWRLLVSTAALGKSENIAPNLAGNFMRSILEGLPFPETMLRAVLTRIKAEHEISYPRAKLLKGCLNRKWRFNNPNNERMLTVSLDTQNTNVGYRLGRLFSVLEKIQEAASPGLNATIKDRFYASASTTPAAAFANLMRLAVHHLSKLAKEKPGYKVNLEKAMQEILDGIDGFPPHLALDDQGQFAIGYYHQRQSFFTKKDDGAGA